MDIETTILVESEKCKAHIVEKDNRVLYMIHEGMSQYDGYICVDGKYLYIKDMLNFDYYTVLDMSLDEIRSTNLFHSTFIDEERFNQMISNVDRKNARKVNYYTERIDCSLYFFRGSWQYSTTIVREHEFDEDYVLIGIFGDDNAALSYGKLKIEIDQLHEEDYQFSLGVQGISAEKCIEIDEFTTESIRRLIETVLN